MSYNTQETSEILISSKIDRTALTETLLMPLFNALGRKKVKLNIYDILTMEIRPFDAFRTWKVHVVIFSFHATHFDRLFTPLNFRYVKRTIRHPVYHATHFHTLLTTLHFWYVNAQFDFLLLTVRRVRTLVVFVC